MTNSSESMEDTLEPKLCLWRQYLDHEIGFELKRHLPHVGFPHLRSGLERDGHDLHCGWRRLQDGELRLRWQNLRQLRLDRRLVQHGSRYTLNLKPLT